MCFLAPRVILGPASISMMELFNLMGPSEIRRRSGSHEVACSEDLERHCAWTGWRSALVPEQLVHACCRTRYETVIVIVIRQ